GLALRLLSVHEGKVSADTPEDTWAFASPPRPAPMPRAEAGAPPLPSAAARPGAEERADELRAGASPPLAPPPGRGQGKGAETEGGAARSGGVEAPWERRAAD